MRRRRYRCESLTALALALFLGACANAPAPRGTCLYPWPTDVAQQKAVEAKGDCVHTDEVVFWMPRGAVTAHEQQSWLELVTKGVRQAKELVGRRDWNFRGDRRLYFYLLDAQFVCHAPPGNVVYIPLWRMRENQAPWMHEAMHLLIASRRGEWFAASEATQNASMPLWLHEGLAESLAIDADQLAGLPHYSPLIEVPAEGLDRLCCERLTANHAARVLAFVGARGKLPELFSEQRMAYAPAFYTASTSFVRFLQRQFGRTALLRAIECHGEENEELERAIGKPLLRAKGEWLDAIGHRGPR